ncbi:hypothetical protein [Actinokineospora sp.]|uniref:hypothetical protein n=1 Tax=Actinokineospora sp. TaxID=1872133 RepID=UPI003D6AD99A
MAALAEASPLLRSWNRWTRLFGALFPAGVTCQYAGLLTIALDGPPLLAASLLITGMATVSVLTIRLHHATRKGLDIAAALATATHK